jgi:hypothetical protein
MKRFYKRKIPMSQEVGAESPTGSNSHNQHSPSTPKIVYLNTLPSDPAEREKISYYHPNRRD